MVQGSVKYRKLSRKEKNTSRLVGGGHEAEEYLSRVKEQNPGEVWQLVLIIAFVSMGRLKAWMIPLSNCSSEYG